jgi:hypothetical protein
MGRVLQESEAMASEPRGALRPACKPGEAPHREERRPRPVGEVSEVSGFGIL